MPNTLRYTGLLGAIIWGFDAFLFASVGVTVAAYASAVAAAIYIVVFLWPRF